jgi:DNA-binding transcriptional LysR family regulator
MEIEALRWFQLVADGVTVTEVADIAYLTQSGVSRALARLDAEVGTPLLRKSGRTLRMTQAGAAFKPHVDSLLHRFDDGMAAVDQAVDPERGLVSVASQRTLGTWLLPDLVASFLTVHPEVRFELSQVRDEIVTPTAWNERLDLEITTIRPADRSVHWHALLVEPLWLAVPRTHRLAGRASVRLAEVADEPFVTLRAPSMLQEQVEKLCEQAGFAPRMALIGEDVPTLRGFAAAGLGVAIIPALHEGSPDAVDSAVHYLAIDDAGASREIGLGWPVDQRLLPSADLFRRHVIARASARKLPGLLSLSAP